MKISVHSRHACRVATPPVDSRGSETRGAAARWLIAVVVVGVALRTVIAALGWFYWDDLTLHAQARTDGLASVLFRNHDGHLMPGGWLIYYGLAKFAPLAWPPAVAVLAVLNAAACAAVAWLCWTVSPRRSTVLPVTLYVLSPLTLPVTTWLAAAVTTLPVHAAAALLAATAVRYSRSPSHGKLAALVLWTLVGCVFSERMFLTAPMALLLAWCLCPAKALVRATVAVAVPLIAWAAVYLVSVGDPRPDAGGETSAWAMFAQGLTQGLIPTAAGGPWTWERWIPSPPWAEPPLMAFIAGMVVIVAVAVWSWRRLWVWLPTILYPLFALLALVVVRNGPDTAVEITQTLRHFSETAVFAAAGLATLPWSRHLVARIIAVVVMVSAAVSNVTFAAAWREQPGREYFANLKSELARHDGPILNQAVDFSVLTPLTHPDNQLERLLPGVERWSREPGIVGPDGTLIEASLYPMRATLPGKDGDCGTRIETGEESTLRLDGPLIDREWVVRLNYLADEDGEVTLQLDGKKQRFPVQEGLHQIYVQVAGAGETLTIAPGTGTCVQRSEVGVQSPQK